MAKKKTPQKPHPTPATTISPQTLAGVKLPDESRRGIKIMCRVSLQEWNQIRKCARMKPLATYVRDAAMAASLVCANG